VKGLKIDPSEFFNPFPQARISMLKGSIFRPFTYYYVKKGADFLCFLSHFCLPYPWYILHNKRWQKRKEDFKEKIITILLRNLKAQLTAVWGPPGFRKILTWAGEGPKITIPLQTVG
jgi:hypothetical protein